MSAIEKVAALLRHEAELLKACHTLGDDWCGDPAEADYHEMIAVADAAIAERDGLLAALQRIADGQEMSGMIDTKKLRLRTQAVVKGWGNCDRAWLDQSEDTPAAVVGYIAEDGETYPVATIDCDQYYAGHQSLLLAKFYAAANPAAISELLDRLEAAEKERDDLKAKVEEMEKQEPVAAFAGVDEYGPMLTWKKHWLDLAVGADLYTLPGAQGE